jgi:SWI/SNF-related matrix-associated actin-dependent regulator of chromatin subfamily A containing DEAD/H box 1
LIQGKTVQTIAFLAWLAHQRNKRSNQKFSHGLHQLPHLIVVPVSTLANWIREFETFCPQLNVVKYHGSQQERDEVRELLQKHHPKYQSQGGGRRPPPQVPLDVIVAPANYFQKENSTDRKFLNGFHYQYLIVDEAHSLKNAKSTRYKMLDKVKSEHRLLLTG